MVRPFFSKFSQDLGCNQGRGWGGRGVMALFTQTTSRKKQVLLEV